MGTNKVNNVNLRYLKVLESLIVYSRIHVLVGTRGAGILRGSCRLQPLQRA